MKAVYLRATSNNALQTRLDNGEELDGLLSIDTNNCEAVFDIGSRIAIKFQEYSEQDGEITLKNSEDFYSFSTECLAFVR